MIWADLPWWALVAAGSLLIVAVVVAIVMHLHRGDVEHMSRPAPWPKMPTAPYPPGHPKHGQEVDDG